MNEIHITSRTIKVNQSQNPFTRHSLERCSICILYSAFCIPEGNASCVRAVDGVLNQLNPFVKAFLAFYIGRLICELGHGSFRYETPRHLKSQWKITNFVSFRATLWQYPSHFSEKNSLTQRVTNKGNLHPSEFCFNIFFSS